MRAFVIAVMTAVVGCSGCQRASQHPGGQIGRIRQVDLPHVTAVWERPREATQPLRSPAFFVLRAGVEIARRFQAPIDGRALLGELYALPVASGQVSVDGGSLILYADDHGRPGHMIRQQMASIDVPGGIMADFEDCATDWAYAQPFRVKCDLRAGRYYWLSIVNDAGQGLFPPRLLALRPSRGDTVVRHWESATGDIMAPQPELLFTPSLAARLEIVPRGVQVPGPAQPKPAAVKRNQAAPRVAERSVEVWRKPITKRSRLRRPPSFVLDATTEIARRFRAPISARGVMGEFYALPGRGSMTPIVMFVLEDDNGRPGGALASGATFVVAPELPKPGPPSTQSFCLRCQLEAGKRYWFSIAGEEPMFGDEPPRLLALKSSARDTLRLVMRVKPNCKELARVQGGLSVGLAAQLLLLPDGEEVKLPW